MSNETRRLLRVAAYYVALGAALFLLVRFVPEADRMLGGLAGPAADEGQIFGPNSAPPVGGAVAATPWAGALLGAISMLGALAIMIPVTWVYLVTRGHRGFAESVVHTLLILPIAVSGIVIIVQDSVALAFSLAGIVAAVRFRTTLEDTKDAVYVFLAIGVGIASGVQALGLAFVLSLIFNAVVLVLWKTRFGNPYAVRGVGPGGIGLAEAMGGLGGEPTRIVGSDALVAAAGPADLRAVLERATSMERHISEERGRRRKERANALLVVHAAAAGPAQSAVEPLLEDVATRWKLGEIVPVGPAHVALAYLARLDAPGAEGALLDRVLTLGDAGIRAAEMRSLKGLSKRS